MSDHGCPKMGSGTGIILVDDALKVPVPRELLWNKKRRVCINHRTQIYRVRHSEKPLRVDWPVAWQQIPQWLSGRVPMYRAPPEKCSAGWATLLPFFPRRALAGKA